MDRVLHELHWAAVANSAYLGSCEIVSDQEQSIELPDDRKSIRTSKFLTGLSLLGDMHSILPTFHSLLGADVHDIIKILGRVEPFLTETDVRKILRRRLRLNVAVSTLPSFQVLVLSIKFSTLKTFCRSSSLTSSPLRTA